MSNPFPVTTRPWLRITEAKRATSTLVLARGDFALTDTGKQYNGDGATALKDLPQQGTGNSGNSSIVGLTQTEYDALNIKNPSTLYLITD